MDRIETFTKELKLKKAVVGGVDQESVYAAMKELSSICREETGRLREENGQLEKKYRTAAEQLGEAQKQVEHLQFQLEEAQKNQSQYELKFSALTQAIDGVNAGRDRVVHEAQRTAAKIISDAMEKQKSVDQDCHEREIQLEILASKITGVRQQFGTSIDKMRAILTKIMSEIDSFQNDDIKPSSGEEEFTRLVWDIPGRAAK